MLHVAWYMPVCYEKERWRYLCPLAISPECSYIISVPLYRLPYLFQPTDGAIVSKSVGRRMYLTHNYTNASHKTPSMNASQWRDPNPDRGSQNSQKSDNVMMIRVIRETPCRCWRSNVIPEIIRWMIFIL